MSHLFSPIDIRGFKLKNRIVMPPMASYTGTEEGYVTPETSEYYRVRAAGDVGLIIVEHTYILPSGRRHRRQLGLVSDAHARVLRPLVDEIHRHGAGAVIQLTHAGARAAADVIGQTPIAPSTVNTSANDANEPAAVAMDAHQIDQVIEAFVACARRAADAGFDGVELHGAHGYLLNQFMSPVTNMRTDEYGDGPEGRLLLPLRIIRAVRGAVGSELIVMYRLGADDGVPGGITPDDAREIAPHLVDAGVDVIDVSGGLAGYQPFEWKGEGFFADISSRVKAVCGAPVIVTGGIKSPATADSIVRRSKADLVGIGRALLKDPAWAVNARLELGEPGAGGQVIR
jgi:2,4-dienoyl-CoA reductase-like NADH-dependent reductase (Old Yellow Enzyme family)